MEERPKLDPVKFGTELLVTFEEVFPLADRLFFDIFEKAVYIENVRIEIHEKYCIVYQNNKLVFYFPASICSAFSGCTAIALYINTLIRDILSKKGPF